MPNAKLFSARCWLSMIALACMPGRESEAAPQWGTCVPTEVMTHAVRIHVRCQAPIAPSIVYLALSTADAPFASRTLGVGVAAFVSGKVLNALFDTADLSGQAIGCLNTDCRLIQALGIAEPPLPAPPGPTPPTTPEPPSDRATCLADCSDRWEDCIELARSQVQRQQCNSRRQQCVGACPP